MGCIQRLRSSQHPDQSDHSVSLYGATSAGHPTSFFTQRSPRASCRAACCKGRGGLTGYSSHDRESGCCQLRLQKGRAGHNRPCKCRAMTNFNNRQQDPGMKSPSLSKDSTTEPARQQAPTLTFNSHNLWLTRMRPWEARCLLLANLVLAGFVIIAILQLGQTSTVRSSIPVLRYSTSLYQHQLSSVLSNKQCVEGSEQRLCGYPGASFPSAWVYFEQPIAWESVGNYQLSHNTR